MRVNWKYRINRYLNSFSYFGLLSAALFFAISLSPSLIPRPYVAQGVLSGVASAIGYLVGWPK